MKLLWHPRSLALGSLNVVPPDVFWLILGLQKGCGDHPSLNAAFDLSAGLFDHLVLRDGVRGNLRVDGLHRIEGDRVAVRLGAGWLGAGWLGGDPSASGSDADPNHATPHRDGGKRREQQQYLHTGAHSVQTSPPAGGGQAEAA